MHRGKVDPGVSELPGGNELSRDHVNRPLDFFLLQHSISYSRIFKLEFYFMKKCSCRESNSRLLIESTVSYPVNHQDNDAGKCNFPVIIF